MKRRNAKPTVNCNYCFCSGALSFHNLDCEQIRVLRRELVKSGLNSGVPLDEVNEVLHRESVAFCCGLVSARGFIENVLQEFKCYNVSHNILNF